MFATCSWASHVYKWYHMYLYLDTHKKYVYRCIYILYMFFSWLQDFIPMNSCVNSLPNWVSSKLQDTAPWYQVVHHHAVDGRNPAPEVSYIPGGCSGFLPSNGTIQLWSRLNFKKAVKQCCKWWNLKIFRDLSYAFVGKLPLRLTSYFFPKYIDKLRENSDGLEVETDGSLLSP